METRVICIYHSRDLDGWISAAIIRLQFGDIKFLGWDYGYDMPVLDDYEMIIMVDISFSHEIMRSLGYNHSIVWIDHHISAIKDSIEWAYTIYNGIRDDKFAACELTWKHYFPEIKMPELVRLLGRYDCFGHKGTDEEQKVLEFQYGARQVIGNFDEAFATLMIARSRGDWSFDSDLCDDILLQGKAIYKYLCSEAKQSYKKIFPLELDGYKFACINQERFNPVNFGIDYHNDGYDGFACFWYNNGKFTYSLYNDNGLVDCSIIAKNRGGGGHKGAAGFISGEILI
jgi:uncharacterized protein